jgi:arylsulfatase
MHQYPFRKRYGFDHMVVDGWDSDYRPWLKEQAPQSGGWYGGGVTHNDWTARPWHLDDHLHATNWTVEQALKFSATSDPSCPFFLAVSFIAPHPPLQPPAFYMDRYLRGDIPEPVIGDWAVPPEDDGLGDDIAPSRLNLTGERLRSTRAAYYGLINHVDDQLRRLMSPILGVGANTDRDTIIVFTSDHGEMLGDHYLWRKQVPYEPSARIPLMIRAPERFGVQRRSVVDRPACLEDIMPTLLDMAGVGIPDTVEGRSLLPFMRGEDIEWREHLHIEHAPTHQTLTDGKRKFIWHVADGSEQFFDLEADPQERHDLIDDDRRRDEIDHWRGLLVDELAERPEGFSDGTRLVPGRPYAAALPHAGRVEPDWRR